MAKLFRAFQTNSDECNRYTVAWLHTKVSNLTLKILLSYFVKFDGCSLSTLLLVVISIRKCFFSNDFNFHCAEVISWSQRYLLINYECNDRVEENIVKRYRWDWEMIAAKWELKSIRSAILLIIKFLCFKMREKNYVEIWKFIFELYAKTYFISKNILNST